jgi:hypothetical protein
VLIFGVANFVHKNVKNKDELSKTITIVGGAVGALALFWAAFTYYDGALRQKEIWAMSIYQEHTKLTIDPANKNFLPRGKFAEMDPKTASAWDLEYERYEWYVGNALFSFEAILDVTSGGDYGWNKTFEGFIKSHQKYLQSDRFDRERYNAKLQNLLKNTLEKIDSKEPDTED